MEERQAKELKLFYDGPLRGCLECECCGKVMGPACLKVDGVPIWVTCEACRLLEPIEKADVKSSGVKDEE